MKNQVARLDRNVQDVVLPFLVALDTARALSVAILLRYREYHYLVTELENVDPRQYDCAERYARDVAAMDILRKYPGLPTGIDRRAAARKSFYDSEKQCHLTNLRLRDITEGAAVYHADILPELHKVVDFMRQFCRDVLKRLPSSLDLRLGPGATVSDGARLATVPDKFSSVPSMTPGFAPLLPVWDRTAWARAHYRRQHARTSTPVRTVRGNEFFTVPKDSTKDRGAAKGPSLNVAYQMAVGQAIRRRLAAVGVDLRSGQDLHRQLARESSVDDSLVTIDLSSASDTVSYQLVKLALPALWFELTETLREPMTKVEGKWVLLEKYSAMGNGFTFELETLLFLAIVHAAAMLHGESGFNLIAMREVSVYGDDIIAPKRISATVISLLKLFGFTPNPRKTFLSGMFRESCGGDYFNGCEVTPYRLTNEITEPHNWIGLVNGMAWLARRVNRYFRVPLDVGPARVRGLGNIPVPIRQLTGPSWLGDLVIHEESDAWKSRLITSDQVQHLRVWAPVRTLVEWKHFYSDVILASALYGSNSEGVSPRGVEGFRIKRVTEPTFWWDRTSDISDPRLLKVIDRVTGCGNAPINWMIEAPQLQHAPSRDVQIFDDEELSESSKQPSGMRPKRPH